MKSAASLCNTTVLRKNITRFAPVWGLYSAIMLMSLLLMCADGSYVWLAESVAGSLGGMPVVNFFYAFCVVQLLLGDLYSGRMCNALHALPLRRETWFMTHVVSGLLFSLVPNGILALLAALLSLELWAVPLMWLAGATLQYVFFFGVALLSALVVGNRFAMGLVYVILNGFSLIAYWLIHSIYSDLLYGMVLREEVFFLLCPVVQMVMLADGAILVDVQWINGYPTNAQATLGAGWGYMAICAALGLAAGVLALVCYRRRQLEAAGDFMAVKKLSKVFLVLYTLCGGACCQGFFDLFFGENSVLYLVLGLAIGFFTGCMLLERRVKVFRKRNFLGFGAVVLAMMVSILLVRVDPVGLTRWVPKASRVESVYLYTGGSYRYLESGLRLEDPEDVEKVLRIHRLGVTDREQDLNGEPDTRVWLEYTMKSGLRHTRNYVIDVESPEGQEIRRFLSRPEAVLGPLYTGQEELKLVEAEIGGAIQEETGEYVRFTSPKDLNSLMAAILADCAQENLVTDSCFTDWETQTFWVQLQCQAPDGVYYYWEIQATEYCDNLMQWLRDHGLVLEKY